MRIFLPTEGTASPNNINFPGPKKSSLRKSKAPKSYAGRDKSHRNRKNLDYVAVARDPHAVRIKTRLYNLVACERVFSSENGRGRGFRKEKRVGRKIDRLRRKKKASQVDDDELIDVSSWKIIVGVSHERAWSEFLIFRLIFFFFFGKIGPKEWLEATQGVAKPGRVTRVHPPSIGRPVIDARQIRIWRRRRCINYSCFLKTTSDESALLSGCCDLG